MADLEQVELQIIENTADLFAAIEILSKSANYVCQVKGWQTK